MTQQVYKFLTRPKKIKAQIDYLNLQIEDLRMIMQPSGIRYDTDKVQSSVHDSMDRYLDKLSLLVEKLDALKGQYLDVCDEISDAIEELGNIYEQQVLLLKYIQGKNYNEIVEATSFSISSVYRLHRKGTARLDSVLDKRKFDSK